MRVNERRVSMKKCKYQIQKESKRNASPLTSFGHQSLATKAWNEDFTQQMIWKLKMFSQQVAEKWMPVLGYVQNVDVKHRFVIDF